MTNNIFESQAKIKIFLIMREFKLTRRKIGKKFITLKKCKYFVKFYIQNSNKLIKNSNIVFKFKSEKSFFDFLLLIN